MKIPPYFIIFLSERTKRMFFLLVILFSKHARSQLFKVDETVAAVINLHNKLEAA